MRNEQEPVAWAVFERGCCSPMAISTVRDDADRFASMKNDISLRNCEVVPLVRLPALTDEERDAVEELLFGNDDESVKERVRGLLERLGGPSCTS